MKLSTEVELVALLHTATELIWWQQFFKEVGFDAKETQIINYNNI